MHNLEIRLQTHKLTSLLNVQISLTSNKKLTQWKVDKNLLTRMHFSHNQNHQNIIKPLEKVSSMLIIALSFLNVQR